jgi:hypothetical protein
LLVDTLPRRIADELCEIPAPIEISKLHVFARPAFTRLNKGFSWAIDAKLGDLGSEEWTELQHRKI